MYLRALGSYMRQSPHIAPIHPWALCPDLKVNPKPLNPLALTYPWALCPDFDVRGIQQ